MGNQKGKGWMNYNEVSLLLLNGRGVLDYNFTTWFMDADGLSYHALGGGGSWLREEEFCYFQSVFWLPS